jgi:hypothetical protein
MPVLEDLFSSTDADLTWQGMDPDVSDLELDENAVSEACSDSVDQDSDSDEDLDSSDLHPALAPASNVGGADNSLPDRESDSGGVDEEASAASGADVPEVVQKLRPQLLSGYKPPNHPSINDNPRGRSLTSAEELSLKHYIAWVDSRGTVKAYKLHAEVLREATGMEIISLYMARKFAIELTGLSSQLVDMCPKSCMAFTGEFKDLQSCIYIHDKRHVCGQPCYDKKGCPRAQMLYTPIAPVIQTFYKNRKMAEAMQY